MQGKGLGRIRLIDALKWAAKALDEVGLALVVLDVLADGDEQAITKRLRFYKSFGFTVFPSMPMRLFIPVRTIRQMLS